MPRPLRPIADGLIYHVINRGNNRQPGKKGASRLSAYAPLSRSPNRRPKQTEARDGQILTTCIWWNKKNGRLKTRPGFVMLLCASERCANFMISKPTKIGR